MKFRSDNKKINQYMIHAVEIEIFENGRLVEFTRGIDKGYAIIENGNVAEIFVREARKFDAFKAERKIFEIIEELNEDWIVNKI